MDYTKYIGRLVSITYISKNTHIPSAQTGIITGLHQDFLVFSVTDSKEIIIPYSQIKEIQEPEMGEIKKETLDITEKDNQRSSVKTFIQTKKIKS